MTGKALTQLKNLCIGTGLQGLAEWTTADNMNLLVTSMAGNFQRHGNPLGKVKVEKEPTELKGGE